MKKTKPSSALALQRWFRFFLLLMLLVGGVPIVHAHPLHLSSGVAEFNSDTSCLEVSLTVFISDLELALTRRSGQEMRLEKTPDAAFDAQVRVYLVEMFVVADAAEGRAELKWVGRQVEEETLKGDDPRMTLFFEVSLPKGPAGVTLRNQMFCELFEDQSNLVFLRLGTHRQQVRFEPGSAAVDLGGP